MSRERSIDERISLWLVEEAPDQLPDRVLQAALERTRPIGQRRAPLRLRPFPMPRFTPAAFALGAAAMLILAVGVALIPPSNPFGTGQPSGSPTVTAGPTADPTPSLAPISLTGQIAFERTVDGNTDIHLMNLDRTGLVRLTDDPAADISPSWSPDGRRIVFRRLVATASDLFIMNADGTDPRRLTESPESEYDARHSPDGRTIAFWRGGDVGTELRLMDSDGSNDRLVARFEGTFAAGIGWTADGRAILFNQGVARGGGAAILAIDLASKALTSITTRPERDGSFAVSNDGSTIAFQSDRLPAGTYLMDVDGSNVRHLTRTQETGYPSSWSPDGTHLVYSQPDGWLYLANTDGTEVTKWAQGGLEVAWRPGP